MVIELEDLPQMCHWNLVQIRKTAQNANAVHAILNTFFGWIWRRADWVPWLPPRSAKLTRDTTEGQGGRQRQPGCRYR